MDLLIELFSEEIPARMQARARDDLRRLITDGLVEAGLTYRDAGAFSTPRRLTLSVTGLDEASKPAREERKGPRADAPDKAIEGFLRSTGLTREQLTLRDDKKGQVYLAVLEKAARPAAEITAEVLRRTILEFPWPKSMRWGDGSLRWVRPLHGIVCLLSDETGAQVVPLEIAGIVAGNVTHGHRFMAPEAISVNGFDDYAAKLQTAKVMLDSDQRVEVIRQQAANLAFARGWEVVEDDALLTEISGLVEWPVPLIGVIEQQFLSLPPEVLQTSMKEHQKFLSVRNVKTARIEGFVTVANIETQDDGATILAGNQRVLAARLSDGLFFWENDLREARSGMENWAEAQSSVTFHAKLGSEADRIERIAALARELAPAVGADPDLAEQAARVAKLDLRSEMVGEFPELQGVMGREYAIAAGMPQDVADAARDHYAPRGPDEAVPTAPVSVAVALADKLDMLTGFWAIDEKPTGSKDTFALRRAALGVIRLVLGNNCNLSLSEVFEWHRLDVFAAEIRVLLPNEFLEIELLYPVTDSEGEVTEVSFNFPALPFGDAATWIAKSAVQTGFWEKGFTISLTVELMSRRRKDWGSTSSGDTERLDETLLRIDVPPFDVSYEADLLSFLHDRLKIHLREQGVRHDAIDAVLAMPGNDDLLAVTVRATALSDMLKTKDGENLLQGLKRAENILTQAEEKDGVEYSFGPDPKLARTDVERALFTALDTAEPEIARAIAAEDYPAAMTAIAALRAPIDAFFEGVQVNADSPLVRRNRLNLLHRIRETGRRIADFTRLEG